MNGWCGWCVDLVNTKLLVIVMIMMMETLYNNSSYIANVSQEGS
jgi:hypothetical protein